MLGGLLRNWRLILILGAVAGVLAVIDLSIFLAAQLPGISASMAAILTGVATLVLAALTGVIIVVNAGVLDATREAAQATRADLICLGIPLLLMASRLALKSALVPPQQQPAYSWSSPKTPAGWHSLTHRSRRGWYPPQRRLYLSCSFRERRC